MAHCQNLTSFALFFELKVLCTYCRTLLESFLFFILSFVSFTGSYTELGLNEFRCLCRFLAPSSLQRDDIDQQDLQWMEEEIVVRYKFEKDENKDMWTRQPNFKDALGTREFIDAANRVKEFFVRHNNWELTKKNPKFRNKNSCLNLLYITAARYLFVTHVLYDLYNRIKVNQYQLIPCSRAERKKIIIPESGVCYPEPYGSASCTSDYDVGLVGSASGYLTEAFNNYFQGGEGFGKPSEIVFDTNVYAFTLEFSMPFLFSGLPVNLANGVARKEKTVEFKMQELASAYYKVFKYNKNFFNTMVEGAQKAMNPVLAKDSRLKLIEWLKTFSDLNKEVPMKGNGDLTTLRTTHNNKYQAFVKMMSVKGGYESEFLGNCRCKSLLNKLRSDAPFNLFNAKLKRAQSCFMIATFILLLILLSHTAFFEWHVTVNL